jgi:hypothetical protein
MAYRIPFNRASVVGSELAYVSEALEQGHIRATDLSRDVARRYSSRHSARPAC